MSDDEAADDDERNPESEPTLAGLAIQKGDFSDDESDE